MTSAARGKAVRPPGGPLRASSPRPAGPPNRAPGAPRTIGWREWAALPDLGIPAVRVKVDSGARSSSLHATQLTPFERDGRTWVRFWYEARGDREAAGLWCEAPSLGVRAIRSSSGTLQRRHVIATRIALGDDIWTIEVSLADRQEMGFEMLVGRTAIRRRFLVDPGRSYLQSRPRRRTRPGATPKHGGEEE